MKIKFNNQLNSVELFHLKDSFNNFEYLQCIKWHYRVSMVVYFEEYSFVSADFCF